jgi:hypothetical protein
MNIRIEGCSVPFLGKLFSLVSMDGVMEVTGISPTLGQPFCGPISLVLRCNRAFLKLPGSPMCDCHHGFNRLHGLEIT